MQPVAETKPWKDLPLNQASEDTLWEITKNYNCFLVKNQRVTLSTDPMNLTGLNTKKDSGIANQKALGIGIVQTTRKIKEKRAKKKANVIRFSLRIKTKRQIPKSRMAILPEKILRFHNNAVYSDRMRIPARAIVKALHRDLHSYRRDLIPVAMRRLKKLQSFKIKNKWQNRVEAKKLKA